MSSAPVAVLGTINEDGTPHLVPIAFALDGDTMHTAVDHKPKSTTRLKRLENIERDPRVTILVQGYSDDWDELWWARLDGHARVRDAPSARAAELLAERYEPYRTRPPDGRAIEIELHRFYGWSARA